MRLARWAVVIAWLSLASLVACARDHGRETNGAPAPGEPLRPDAGRVSLALDASQPLRPLSAADAGVDPLAVCEKPRKLISFGEQVEAVCFDLTELTASGSFPRLPSGSQSLDDAGAADRCPSADALAWPSIGELCAYLPVCDDVLPEGRPAWGEASSRACCYWVQRVRGV